MGKKHYKKSISVKPRITLGPKINVTDSIEIENFKHPIFCFKHLHRKHHLENCDNSEKKSLIEKLVNYSQLTWTQIQLANAHGMGSEKIPIDSIKPSIPPFITEDVKFLIALRFQGKKAMIGHKNQFIFHLIYIDRDFTVYDH